MEGNVTGDVAAALKAARGESPGVRFCLPSARIIESAMV